MSKLLLHPEDPVYPSLMAFLVLKPTLDLGNVPEMYKLLLSSSTEHFERERHWLLQLLADGLREPNDYNVIEKRFGFKLILSQFATSLADHRSRALILRLVKAAVHHPSIAVDLCRRANLIGWLVLAVRQPAVTRWEVGFLAEIFVIAARHVASSAVDSLIKSNMIVGCFAMKNALAMVDDGAKKTWLGQVEKLAQQS
uniref:Nucleolar pre-ribosomal-associated protein 1 C-terminal domain-containing protein n=1 Tax=Plectus sambesii TaxID=2011161 RepID=A0A914XGN3_9BILA